VKRVALLGATGSIGRQAIEIVEAHPELELCAVASGSTPLDDVDAPLKQVGGDLTELLEQAQPDVVLNAVVGFAGIHATLWSLEHGVDLALANKESLVAAGELALAARARGAGRIPRRLHAAASSPDAGMADLTPPRPGEIRTTVAELARMSKGLDQSFQPEGGRFATTVNTTGVTRGAMGLGSRSPVFSLSHSNRASENPP